MSEGWHNESDASSMMSGVPMYFPLLAILLMAAVPSAAPREFAGVPLGISLSELRHLYPDARRNPDSDAKFSVYMVAALKGVPAQSPAAFSFYRGRLIGGQVLLNTSIAPYWLKRTIDRYGRPQVCIYCEQPDMATARWHWADGTAIVIDAGGMLSEFTREGSEQRREWIERGASAELGDDEAAEERSASESAAGKPALQERRKSQAAAPAKASWHDFYESAKRRLSTLFGY